MSKGKGKGDRSAVSEILGNILILGITVTLFTSVMAFVSAIPEPPEQVSATFDAQLSSDLLSITHTGGSDLEYGNVYIVVTANDYRYSFPLSNGSLSTVNEGQPWRQGTTWSLNMTEHNQKFLSGDDPFIPETLDVAVQYVTLPEYLWSKTLKTDEVLPIQITNFQILDEVGHTSNIIAIGSNFTVRMNVLAPSTDVQVQAGGVKVDLSSLYNNTGSPVILTNVGGSLYSFTSTSPPTSGTNTYTVRISVMDDDGITIQEFRQVRIVTDNNQTTPVTPVDPTPPDEPTTPGITNPSITNDLYFLSYEDWVYFRLYDGTVDVSDSYALVDDRFVLAFKSDSIGISGPRDWGGTANGSPQMFITTYNSIGEVIEEYDVSHQIPEGVTLNGTNWEYLVFNFNSDESTALNSIGLFVKIDIKVKQGSTDRTVSQAFANFYKPGNPGTYVRSFAEAGQGKGVFEIGDDIFIRVYTPHTGAVWNQTQSSSFRVTSLHDYSLTQDIDVTYERTMENALIFRVDSFEVVGTYLNSSSLFIHCQELRLDLIGGGSASMKVSAKIYVTEDHVVGPGQSFTTLSAAINSPLVQSGDSIRVFSGTYSGNLIISKQLLIWGNKSNTSIISPITSNPTLSLAGSAIDFRGFKVDSPSGGDSVVSIIGSDILLSTNNILNSGRAYSVHVQSSDSVSIFGNIIAPSTSWNGRTFGLLDSTSLNVCWNIITSSSSSAYQFGVDSCSMLNLSNNTIVSSTGGGTRTVHITNSPGAIMDGNIFQGSTGSATNQILIEFSSGVEIRNNSIISSTGGGTRTVHILNSPGVVLEGNEFQGSTDSATNQIRVDLSSSSQIRNNTIMSCTGGGTMTIYVTDSPGMSIFGNEFLGSTSSATSQIYVKDSSNATISTNLIISCTNGGARTVQIINSVDSIFTNNIITGPTLSLEYQVYINGCDNIIVSYNNIVPTSNPSNTIYIINSPDYDRFGNSPAP